MSQSAKRIRRRRGPKEIIATMNIALSQVPWALSARELLALDNWKTFVNSATRSSDRGWARVQDRVKDLTDHVVRQHGKEFAVLLFLSVTIHEVGHLTNVEDKIFRTQLAEARHSFKIRPELLSLSQEVFYQDVTIYNVKPEILSKFLRDQGCQIDLHASPAAPPTVGFKTKDGWVHGSISVSISAAADLTRLMVSENAARGIPAHTQDCLPQGGGLL